MFQNETTLIMIIDAAHTVELSTLLESICATYRYLGLDFTTMSFITGIYLLFEQQGEIARGSELQAGEDADSAGWLCLGWRLVSASVRPTLPCRCCGRFPLSRNILRRPPPRPDAAQISIFSSLLRPSSFRSPSPFEFALG